MSKKCLVSGRKTAVGNRVSHANNRVKRRFEPNLQKASLMSEILRKIFHLTISTRGLRTVEKNGGLDKYLLDTPNSKLSAEAKEIKKSLLKKQKAEK